MKTTLTVGVLTVRVWTVALLGCALATGCTSTGARPGSTPDAALVLSPAGDDFGGVPVGSSSPAQAFTVVNTGGSPASNMFLALATGKQFSVSGNTCGTSSSKVAIAAGATCTFAVTFSPTAMGPQSDTLTVTFDSAEAAGLTRTASLQGTGQTGAATLFVSPASHDFANVTVGSSSPPFTFTVANPAGSPASNVYLSLATGTQFAISGNGCGTPGSKVTIPAGGSCAFGLAFSPTAPGPAYDTVKVTYDTASGSGLSRSATVSGTGLTTVASLVFSPPSHDFANVTVGASSAPQGFTVTNGGSAPAGNVYLAIAAGTHFSIAGNGCGTAASKVSIAGGGTCSFSVTFTPTGVGPHSDTLTITYDGVSAGQTATAALSGTGLSGTTHGLSIPGTHPRLWYDAARLAAAKTWYQSHPFTPSGNEWSGAGYIDSATRGLLNSEPSQCQTAINWAVGASQAIPLFSPTGSVACDDCRWFGEQIILTYDFCYDQMTASQKSSLIASVNAWLDSWGSQTKWGNVPMHQNNYYWGYLRDELEWAITSYQDNVTMAEKFLGDVLDKRLATDFNPATTTDSRGGVGQEGSQYGPYLTYYATVPFVTAGLLGRDLLTETNFWKEAVYAFVYGTTPGPNTPAGGASSGYTFFPSSDDEGWSGRSVGGDTTANFMTAAAMRWSTFNVGGHSRQWLTMTGAGPDRYVQSVDPGGTAIPFTNLPLDYYASGARYLWGRNAWGPSSTAFFLQLGDRKTSLLGHSHVDWGTWQIWRNGRFLSRETVGYANSIVGYGGSGSVGTDTALAHNSVLVNGAGPSGSPWSNGTAVVKRLESRPGYSYADVDLTPASGNFVHLEREFVFVRALETLVILDRIQSTSAADVKAFIAHCETSPVTSANGATCTNGNQALVMTTLLPASPTYRMVTEGTMPAGQYRIEVLTSPGTAQSYILTVLQAKDAAAGSLSPLVTDNGTSYTVTLDGSNSITLVKGMTSSGGSITTGGGTSTFRSDVQPMIVSDNGPAWQ